MNLHKIGQDLQHTADVITDVVIDQVWTEKHCQSCTNQRCIKFYICETNSKLRNTHKLTGAVEPTDVGWRSGAFAGQVIAELEKAV